MSHAHKEKKAGTKVKAKEEKVSEENGKNDENKQGSKKIKKKASSDRVDEEELKAKDDKKKKEDTAENDGKKKKKHKEDAKQKDEDKHEEIKSEDPGEEPKKKKKKKKAKENGERDEGDDGEKEGDEEVGVIKIDPSKPLDEQLVSQYWLADVPLSVLYVKGITDRVERITNSRSNNVVVVQDCKNAEVVVDQNQRFAALYYVGCVDCRFQVLDSAVIATRTTRVIDCHNCSFVFETVDMRKCEVFSATSCNFVYISEPALVDVARVIWREGCLNNKVTIGDLLGFQLYRVWWTDKRTSKVPNTIPKKNKEGKEVESEQWMTCFDELLKIRHVRMTERGDEGWQLTEDIREEMKNLIPAVRAVLPDEEELDSCFKEFARDFVAEKIARKKRDEEREAEQKAKKEAEEKAKKEAAEEKARKEAEEKAKKEKEEKAEQQKKKKKKNAEDEETKGGSKKDGKKEKGDKKHKEGKEGAKEKVEAEEPKDGSKVKKKKKKKAEKESEEGAPKEKEEKEEKEKGKDEEGDKEKGEKDEEKKEKEEKEKGKEKEEAEDAEGEAKPSYPPLRLPRKEEILAALQELADNPPKLSRQQLDRAYDEERREFEEDEEALSQKAAEAARLIKRAKHCIVFTGAGISTSANIPDFRGPQGVWTRQAKNLPPVDKMAKLTGATPTYAHYAITELVRRNLIKFVVSTNMDGLHLRSGLPPHLLMEQHGNSYKEICEKCNCTYMRDYDVLNDVSNPRAHYTGRLCDFCGGKLKDTIVHFSEEFRGEHDLAISLDQSSKADLVLVLGTSMNVQPNAVYTSRVFKNPEGQMVIINLQKTPYDRMSSLRVFARTDNFMEALMRALEIEDEDFDRSYDAFLDWHKAEKQRALENKKKEKLQKKKQQKKGKGKPAEK